MEDENGTGKLFHVSFSLHRSTHHLNFHIQFLMHEFSPPLIDSFHIQSMSCVEFARVFPPVWCGRLRNSRS